MHFTAWKLIKQELFLFPTWAAEQDVNNLDLLDMERVTKTSEEDEKGQSIVP